MSQYGALGMSQSGSDYISILKFYYGDITIVKVNNLSDVKIQVNTVDSDSCPDGTSIYLEDYLKGLAEMPDYWGKASKGGYEALKAQIVAARTYAYMKTHQFTKPICNSSRCQVFRCSNINAHPHISQAVEDTEGQIIVDAVSQTAFSTEYARSFCGASRSVVCTNHTNPSVDATQNYNYESKANKGNDPFCK